MAGDICGGITQQANDGKYEVRQGGNGPNYSELEKSWLLPTECVDFSPAPSMSSIPSASPSS